jgi:hypothetical protein
MVPIDRSSAPMSWVTAGVLTANDLAAPAKLPHSTAR